MKKHVYVLFILGLLAAGLALGWLQLSSAQAAGANRVGLVVSYGNGAVKSQCISFSKNQITGLAVLQASGLPLKVSYGSMGAEVCKIGKVGCPVNNCFCDSPPNFWAYWHLQGGNWVFSQLGASNYSVSDGAVEGWVWGNGQSNPPAQTSFDQICAPLPTQTQTPDTTPTKAPSKTPAPTQKPSQTPVPATDVPSSTQAADQSNAASEPTQTLEQPNEPSTSPVTTQAAYLPLVSGSEASPEDTLLPTAIAAISTPAPTSAATQTGQGNSTESSGSNSGWTNYLFLGVIIAVLGIGVFLAKQKWK